MCVGQGVPTGIALQLFLRLILKNHFILPIYQILLGDFGLWIHSTVIGEGCGAHP